jgi:hypothetical protein
MWGLVGQQHGFLEGRVSKYAETFPVFEVSLIIMQSNNSLVQSQGGRIRSLISCGEVSVLFGLKDSNGIRDLIFHSFHQMMSRN